MPPYDPQYDIFREAKDPAEQWQRDRGVITSWLKRQCDAALPGAERRLDGTSNAVITSEEFGVISVHDYWSFCRPDFNPGARQQSYDDILARQASILSFDFALRGATPPRNIQLVVFLNGEMDTTQGYAESFMPFTAGRPAGALIAVESSTTSAQQVAVDLYHDELYHRFLGAVRQAVLGHSQPNL
ncbi:MAG TPA: hypothetical protein VI322_05150 [Candidatus Saccharimonadia bacterium]